MLTRGAGLIALEREADRSHRSGVGFAVAFVDLDGLKQVNDLHGHAAGDAALRTVGDMLTSGLRPYDIALRYGGDEFVCVLSGSSVAEAYARLRQLQRALSSPPLGIEVTFGAVAWRRGEDTDSLLARADAAFYEVRRSSRGIESGAARPAGADTDEESAVLAHGLLNSAAFLMIGAESLQETGSGMTEGDRAHLLERMYARASSISDGLKEIIRSGGT